MTSSVKKAAVFGAGSMGSGIAAQFANAGVPFTTASDAHHDLHVADNSTELARLLSSFGIDTLRGFTQRRPRDVALATGQPENATSSQTR